MNERNGVEIQLKKLLKNTKAWSSLKTMVYIGKLSKNKQGRNYSQSMGFPLKFTLKLN